MSQMHYIFLLISSILILIQLAAWLSQLIYYAVKLWKDCKEKESEVEKEKYDYASCIDHRVKLSPRSALIFTIIILFVLFWGAIFICKNIK